MKFIYWTLLFGGLYFTNNFAIKHRTGRSNCQQKQHLWFKITQNRLTNSTADVIMTVATRVHYDISKYIAFNLFTFDYAFLLYLLTEVFLFWRQNIIDTQQCVIILKADGWLLKKTLEGVGGRKLFITLLENLYWYLQKLCKHL